MGILKREYEKKVRELALANQKKGKGKQDRMTPNQPLPRNPKKPVQPGTPTWEDCRHEMARLDSPFELDRVHKGKRHTPLVIVPKPGTDFEEYTKDLKASHWTFWGTKALMGAIQILADHYNNKAHDEEIILGERTDNE